MHTAWHPQGAAVSLYLLTIAHLDIITIMTSSRPLGTHHLCTKSRSSTYRAGNPCWPLKGNQWTGFILVHCLPATACTSHCRIRGPRIKRGPEQEHQQLWCPHFNITWFLIPNFCTGSFFYVFLHRPVLSCFDRKLQISCTDTELNDKIQSACIHHYGELRSLLHTFYSLNSMTAQYAVTS